VRPFELSTIGGPWAKRLSRRRKWIDELPWDEALPRGDDALDPRAVWTRTAFSEYASAAAFAEIAAASLRAAAPIDLVAAAGDFVVDEILHAEVAARIANALGGAVAMAVELDKLVRPPTASKPVLRAAELVVRTSCVGESLTVPMLKLSRNVAGSVLIEAALRKIVSDESGHAQFGWWFLDWAEAQLDETDREHLANVASDAVSAFAPLLGGACSQSGLGVVGCDRYDPSFVTALTNEVAKPLAERGIEITQDALSMVAAAAAS
jgi:hypothetical protein